MSALEQNSVQATERRAGERYRVGRLVARAGRHDAVIVDLSMGGARIWQQGALRRGSTIRVTFDWEHARFAATAEVLATRVVSLGFRNDEPAVYESRVRFVAPASEALAILAAVITHVSSAELRTWVGNLRGEPEGPLPKRASASGFLRCRFIHRRWETMWTRDASQSSDGFTLPAGTEQADINALCRVWEEMDDDARELVRRTAAVIAEEATAP